VVFPKIVFKWFKPKYIGVLANTANTKKRHSTLLEDRVAMRKR